jgi:hypothetical protein
MVARALVSTDIDDGSQLLKLLDAERFDVDAAFWLLTEEWSDWWLVLATHHYDQDGPGWAQRRVLRIARSVPGLDFLYDKLAVVGRNDRRVRALRRVMPHGPPKAGYHLGRFYAENLVVLDSYVYRLRAR